MLNSLKIYPNKKLSIFVLNPIHKLCTEAAEYYDEEIYGADICIFNKYEKLSFAQELIALIQDVFTEVDNVQSGVSPPHHHREA